MCGLLLKEHQLLQIHKITKIICDFCDFMYLHLFLFVHDKLFCKKEDKSGFSVYLILFVAGFLASGSMAWLFFNQDLKFSSSGTKVIEHKGVQLKLMM